MGRLFDIAKQTEKSGAMTAHDTPTDPFAEPLLAARLLSAVEARREPAEDADALHDDDDVPYIEVGPRRSMEASASVLAAGPMPHLPRVERPALASVLAPPAAAPAPRTVVFQPVSPEVLHRRRHSQFSTELIAFHDPEHPVSGQYHDLLTPLMAALPSGRAQALLFTSALADAGTTTVLLNVAVTAARLGRRRVAVLDANVRKPAVAQLLGLPDATGLRQVLTGSATLEVALQKTEQDNLFAVTAGVENLGGNLRFVAETVRSVVRQLRQRFDLVFIDGPAWDGNTDAVQAALACDAVYLVLSQREADSPRVDELFQALPDKGVRLAGCIFVG